VGHCPCEALVVHYPCKAFLILCVWLCGCACPWQVLRTISHGRVAGGFKKEAETVGDARVLGVIQLLERARETGTQLNLGDGGQDQTGHPPRGQAAHCPSVESGGKVRAGATLETGYCLRVPCP